MLAPQNRVFRVPRNRGPCELVVEFIIALCSWCGLHFVTMSTYIHSMFTFMFSPVMKCVLPLHAFPNTCTLGTSDSNAPCKRETNAGQMACGVRCSTRNNEASASTRMKLKRWRMGQKPFDDERKGTATYETCIISIHIKVVPQKRPVKR